MLQILENSLLREYYRCEIIFCFLEILLRSEIYIKILNGILISSTIRARAIYISSLRFLSYDSSGRKAHHFVQVAGARQSFNHRLAIPCGGTFLHPPVLPLPPPRAILSGFQRREQRFLISMVRCWWKISLDISCRIEAFRTRVVYLPPIYARSRRHRLLNRSFEEILQPSPRAKPRRIRLFRRSLGRSPLLFLPLSLSFISSIY